MWVLSLVAILLVSGGYIAVVCGRGSPSWRVVEVGNGLRVAWMCYLFGMVQVQINLRCSPEQLAVIEAARGSLKRNAFCVEAILARAAEVGVAPVRVMPVEAPLSRPSVRAPRGCRVVGVPAALRESPPVIPGQLTAEEVIAGG